MNIEVLVPEEKKNMLEKAIIEATSATAVLEWGKDCIYAVLDKKIILF